MALSFAPATGTVLDHVLRDTYPVWGEGLSFDAYARYARGLRRTAWGQSHLERVVLLDGARLLASAARHDLSARIDGRIRRVLGIGSIFTPRELRGRGAASAIIAHLVDAANTEGHEFVLLFSDIGPALYERLDFVPLPLEQATLAVHIAGRRAGDAGAGRRRSRHPAHRRARADAAPTGARLALDRTEDYIRHAITRRRLLAGLGPPGLRQIEFLVAEEGHMAVAYLVCTAHHGRWTIEEAGDRDPTGRAARRDAPGDAGARAVAAAARDHGLVAACPDPAAARGVGATRHRRGDDDPPAARPHAADAAAGGVRTSCSGTADLF